MKSIGHGKNRVAASKSTKGEAASRNNYMSRYTPKKK